MNKLCKNLRTGLSIWLLLPYVMLATGSSFLHTCSGYECVEGSQSHGHGLLPVSCDRIAFIAEA